jgi:hypothetical protein
VNSSGISWLENCFSFFFLLLFSSLTKMHCRKLQKEFFKHLGHPGPTIQDFGLLSCPGTDLIPPSETATPPVEHNTSPAQKGTTKSNAACGKIASPLDKTGGQINQGNISPPPGGYGVEC